MDKERIKNLQERAKQRLDKAETPEEIKAATEEMSMLEGVAEEAEKLEETNKNLLTSYKEALKGQPIKLSKADAIEEDEEAPLEFEDALKKVLDARKN